MKIFSFHITRTGISTTGKALFKPPNPNEISGLEYSECMTVMTLGAPIVSPKRMQLKNLVMFAAWESEEAINNFLDDTKLGQSLSTGWHVRMEFVRRWGYVNELRGLPENVTELDENAPVIAVTLARMKLPQVPRFIQWGKPVEKLVRDHPGTTLALASMRLPRTVSTFSVWKTQREMLDMVQGHSSVPKPKRHAKAMVERDRKDFHFEFTTLRFKPISEHGEWLGRKNIIPFKINTDV